MAAAGLCPPALSPSSAPQLFHHPNVLAAGAAGRLDADLCPFSFDQQQCRPHRPKPSRTMTSNPKFVESYILDKNFPSDGNETLPRAARREPLHALGALDRLPVELTHAVLARLDLRSLVNVSYTNRQGLRLCESMTEYAALVTHAPRIVYYVLSTDAGRWARVADLHAALLDARCGTCPDAAAGYYDVLRGRRLCHACLRADQADHKRMHPLRHATAAGAYALDPAAMSAVPQIRTVPGRALPSAYDGQARITMFDCAAARAAGVARHGSVEAMEAAALAERMRQHGTSRADEERMSACRVCYAQHRAYYADRVHVDDALYWLAVVRMPWLRAREEAAERSFYCPGCRAFPFASDSAFRRRFFTPDYARHLRLLGPLMARRGDRHDLLKGEASDVDALRVVCEGYAAVTRAAEAVVYGA